MRKLLIGCGGFLLGLNLVILIIFGSIYLYQTFVVSNPKTYVYFDGLDKAKELCGSSKVHRLGTVYIGDELRYHLKCLDLTEITFDVKG
jgi:hypothetical protein